MSLSSGKLIAVASLAIVAIACSDQRKTAPGQAVPAPPVVEAPLTALASVASARDGLRFDGMDGDVDVKQAGDALIVDDADPGAHRAAKWLFSGARANARYTATGVFRAAGPGGSGSLLRVAELTSVGKERNADCSFEPLTGETASRGDALSTPPTAHKEGERVTITCSIKTSAAPGRLVVYVLPAVGANMTSYSETGIGQLRVDRIDIGLTSP